MDNGLDVVCRTAQDLPPPVLDAVSLPLHTKNNGLVICDSQTALHALAVPKPEALSLVNPILPHPVTAVRHALSIRFLWIASYVGTTVNDMVNRLAKVAYKACTACCCCPASHPLPLQAEDPCFRSPANHPARERRAASERKHPALRPLRLSSLRVPTTPRSAGQKA